VVAARRAAGRLVAAARAAGRALTRPLVGRPVALPDDLLACYPELAEARWRVGGLAPRVGGWLLGARTVSGITLWRTIWLAPGIRPSPALLLHELCHVRQFARSRAFPLRYCWESVRRGYVQNPFEIEADAFARRVLAERPPAGAAPGRGARVASVPGGESPAEEP
jgi:hypothetical protein